MTSTSIIKNIRAAVVLGVLLGVGSVNAEEDSIVPHQNTQQVLTTPDYRGDFLDRSTVTGDWGGHRQDWANHGVTLDANLTQIAQGVTSGGIKNGWEYMGRGEATLNFDTVKMGLWPGGLFTIMGEGKFGDMLTGYTGALVDVNINNVLPETEDSFVLSQVTYTQFLSPQFGIALGKFATINNNGGDKNEFAHGKGNDQFLNLAFNINPVSALTVPYSTLGMSAIYLPTKELITVFSVLDPHGKADSAGFDALFENGATFALEGRYTTNFLDKSGHQLLGGTYSSSDYADLDQNTANLIIPALPTQENEGSWSAYWNADQYFYQPNPMVDRGLGVFARFGISDGEANPIERFASAGIGSKGLIPSRSQDGFGIGYFYTWTADNRVTSQLNFEDAQGAEAYYEVALTPAIRFSPDIQWISPSQTRIDSAWVLGFRLHTVF